MGAFPLVACISGSTPGVSSSPAGNSWFDDSAGGASTSSQLSSETLGVTLSAVTWSSDWLTEHSGPRGHDSMTRVQGGFGNQTCFGVVFGLAPCPWICGGSALGGSYAAHGRLRVINLDLCREYLLQLLECESKVSANGEHRVVDRALCDLHCLNTSLLGRR